jgi:tRNA A-37 threonylcarbamoyl transferase component Bud32
MPSDNRQIALCPSASELSAFQDGQLSAEVRQQIAAHLDVCPRCSAAVRTLSPLDDPLLRDLRHCAAGVPEPSTPVLGPVGNTPAVSEPVPGQHLGQYELLEKLGEGGMGAVYKARHRLMDRVVAIKVIHPRHVAHPGARERFRREIRALARLDHPHIVRAQYADEADGVHFLVMEYVPGSSLAQEVAAQGPLSVARACATIQQAAEALQCAHEASLVHRDIKPSNLLITPDGQVKVLDLGLALVREEAVPGGGVTAVGEVMGTYDYMAPEQWRDTHSVDIRADLYSLGCTLYFILTGHPPFAAEQYALPAWKKLAHAAVPITSIRERRPDVPVALEAVLRRLLAKDPDERYGTPAEVVRALAPFAGGMSDTEGAPTAVHPVPRRRRVLWPIGLLFVVIGLGAVILATTWRPAQPPLLGLPERLPTITTPAAELTLAPLAVVSLTVNHYRGNPPLHLGEMGVRSRAARVKDDVKVRVDFGEPCFCYLIAFNPDGEETLCYPREPSEPPARLAELTYPAMALTYYGLTDGPGLQAFVVVASRQSLPAYHRWQKTLGLAPWRRLPAEQAWGVWRSDGRRTELLAGPERGTEHTAGLLLAAVGCTGQDPQAGLAGVAWTSGYLAMRDGPMQRLEEVSKFFRSAPAVDAVWGVAFPVRPTE